MKKKSFSLYPKYRLYIRYQSKHYFSFIKVLIAVVKNNPYYFNALGLIFKRGLDRIWKTRTNNLPLYTFYCLHSSAERLFS